MGEKVILCGIDEAGRGPLAGPVVASCVALPVAFDCSILSDSKALSEKKRIAAAAIIKKNALFGLGVMSHKAIDRLNILEATMTAMRKAFFELAEKLQRTDLTPFLIDEAALEKVATAYKVGSTCIGINGERETNGLYNANKTYDENDTYGASGKRKFDTGNIRGNTNALDTSNIGNACEKQNKRNALGGAKSRQGAAGPLFSLSELFQKDFLIDALAKDVLSEKSFEEGFAHLEYGAKAFLIPLKILEALRVVVDGNKVPKLGCPVAAAALVKADSKVGAVMAASILAKTHRDEIMKTFDRLYPEYQYAKHKGYPTKLHKELCKKFGPSPIQRKTFRW